MARFRYIGRHVQADIRVGGGVCFVPGMLPNHHRATKDDGMGTHPSRIPCRKSVTMIDVDDRLTAAMFRTPRGLDGKPTFQELP